MNFSKLLGLLIATLLLSACTKPVYQAKSDSQFNESSLEQLTFHTTSSQQGILSYVSLGDKAKTPIVMLHGTPGNWETYKYILGDSQLHHDYFLVSVDRLGWGKSKPVKNINPENYSNQVEAIAAIIKEVSDQPVILLGHSLGASLAPQVAIKHPELVSGLILLSGSLNPILGKPRWYNRFASLPGIRNLMPEALAKANKEIYLLNDALSSIAEKWRMINIPVAVVHGKKDKLVDPENTDFVRKKLSHLDKQLSIIELKNAGHFLPWENTDTIVKTIFSLGL